MDRLNTTLNKAIFMVIDSPRKADAKVYHAMVEEAGYVIKKQKAYGCSAGTYFVQNPETNREVHKNYNGVVLGRGCFTRTIGRPRERKIDYVAYLDTPVNNDRAVKSDFDRKYFRARWEVQNLLSDIRYYERQVEETKEQIKRYEDRLVSYAKACALREEELRRFMKEFKEGRKNA